MFRVRDFIIDFFINSVINVVMVSLWFHINIKIDFYSKWNIILLLKKTFGVNKEHQNLIFVTDMFVYWITSP